MSDDLQLSEAEMILAQVRRVFPKAYIMKVRKGTKPMGLVAAATGGDGDFQIAPQGTHIAVCNMVVDLGMQKTEWKGVESLKHQVYIRWETPQERIEYEKDGEPVEGPLCIGKTYTVSLGDKANLRKDLEGWRGRAFTADELNGFDLFNVLGVACQVTVTHRQAQNGKTYANVTGVTGIPKGMEHPKAENPLIKYTSDEADQFDALPKWLQEKVSGPDDNQDYDGGFDGGPDSGSDNDIPF